MSIAKFVFSIGPWVQDRTLWIFVQGSTKQNFQTPRQILSQQQTDQFICLFLLRNFKSSCCVLTMQKLSKPVRTKRYQLQEIKIYLPPCWLNLRHCYIKMAGIHQRQKVETLSYGRRLNNKTSDYFAFRRIDNVSSTAKSPTVEFGNRTPGLSHVIRSLLLISTE